MIESAFSTASCYAKHRLERKLIPVVCRLNRRNNGGKSLAFERSFRRRILLVACEKGIRILNRSALKGQLPVERQVPTR